MSISLVQRLRFDATRCEATFSKGVATNIEEAASRIERLETALRTIVDNYSLKGGNPAQDGAIAHAALKD